MEQDQADQVERTLLALVALAAVVGPVVAPEATLVEMVVPVDCMVAVGAQEEFWRTIQVAPPHMVLKLLGRVVPSVSSGVLAVAIRQTLQTFN